MIEVSDVVSTLEAEVKFLRSKHKNLLSKQREKRDTTYGIAWLAIWEAQIDSYERIISALEGKE